MDFNAFLMTLPIMGKGMLAIFIVTFIIVSCVNVLNMFTNMKKK